MSDELVKKVIGQSWHRNGSGGAGFVVSLFESVDEDTGETVTFIGFSMDPDRPDNPLSEYAVKHAGSERAARTQRAIRDFETHTGVLRLDLLQEGNIQFAEGNSWRGGYYAPALAEAWRASNLADGRDSYDPFDQAEYLNDRLDILNQYVEAFTEERDRIAEMVETAEEAIV